MDEKQIDRSLRRRFSTVGWVLILYYGIMNILAVLAMAAGGLGEMLALWAEGDLWGEVDMAAIMGNAWGYLLTILVGLVVLHAWQGSDFFREAIFRREGAITPGAFLALLCLCAGAQLVNALWVSLLEAVMNRFGRSVLGTLELVSGASDTVSMFLYSAIAAPIAEELLFRGYVLRTLRPYGKRFSILASAFLFAIFHGNLLQAPYAFLAGLVLGYAAAEYSILWAMALHLFNNLILADGMTRVLSYLPGMLGELVSSLVVLGFFLAGAGILLVRRRDVAAYRRREWIDRRCLKCFFTCPGVVVMMVLMAVNMVMMFWM